MLASLIPQSLDIVLDPRILWILFILGMIVYTIISAILLYHWIAYSYAREKMRRVIILYFVTSAIFILTSIGAATAFSLS